MFHVLKLCVCPTDDVKTLVTQSHCQDAVSLDLVKNMLTLN